jgi:hypothetical protein
LVETDIVDTRRPQSYDTTGDAVNDTTFFETRRNKVTGREEIGGKPADGVQSPALWSGKERERKEHPN